MAGFAAHNNTLKMAESQQLETTISTDQSLSVLDSPLLRVHLLIDATHALLTYALVVSVNTGTAEYTFTVQHSPDSESSLKQSVVTVDLSAPRSLSI